MFKKLYRYAFKQRFTPALLTLLVGSLVASIKGALAPSDAFLLLATASLQALLLVYNSLFSAAVPIERLTQSNRTLNTQNVRRIALSLGLTPLLLLVSSWAGWLTLAAVGLYVSRAVATLLHRLFKREHLISEALADLDQYQPMVAVYVSGPANVAYQINQWLPVLERLGVPVVVIARQRNIYEGMPRTDLPVFLFARRSIWKRCWSGEYVPYSTPPTPCTTYKHSGNFV